MIPSKEGSRASRGKKASAASGLSEQDKISIYMFNLGRRADGLPIATHEELAIAITGLSFEKMFKLLKATVTFYPQTRKKVRKAR
jgi:hypothetical protein